MFPGTMLTLPVGRARSVAVLEHLDVGAELVVGVQRDPRTEDPVLADLHPIATVGKVHRIKRLDDGSYRVMIEGLRRVRLADLLHSDPYWRVAVEDTPSEVVTAESQTLADALRAYVTELAGNSGGPLAQAIQGAASPGVLADRIASGLDLDHDAEIEVLIALDALDRLRLVTRLVNEVKTSQELKQKIGEEVRKGLTKHQRDALLREQLRAIHRELGDEDHEKHSDELKDKLTKADLTDEAREVVERELRRLSSLSSASPEYNVVRTYLETIADMPWGKRAEVKDDVDAVGQKLDADHHGLDDVKRRILEHMAVLKLSGNQRGTILCFAGPPGVGKTSLGRSIADATGRPFIRIALGGVRDEAEIRGHRRTYIGAIPGRIVSSLRKNKVKNPVILLDEIDKLGKGWQGDPEAALLELLDPEQNKYFTDHYLELPFDLSEVMFICTANDLGNISAPLRDRLEIVEISGYTPDEKMAIARGHLVEQQLADHALGKDSVEFTEEALDRIVRDYTRESGVRQLKRELGKICRSLALEVARAKDNKPERIVVDAAKVAKILGKARFQSEVAERTAVPGVATGLAWTPVGGDILFLETSKMSGKGNLQTTGQLGDVMKESMRAALTYVRSNAVKLGVAPDFLEHNDVHIHVPAGAVPKDGPSAGVTIFTALTSLLTGRRVRPDTAMTGEVTLRGRVLPVGGIKAKVLAAHRAGIKQVILPHRNERDLDEVPEIVRKELRFVLVDDMSEVLDAALEPVPAPAETLPAIPDTVPDTALGTPPLVEDAVVEVPQGKDPVGVPS
jgi:ATP-dependent Lon protease